MLRITTHDEPRVVTFRLEGRLEGPWVRELERCWCSALGSSAGKTSVRVDLSGVTFIDAEGTWHLAAMHAQGAEFIACDCLMKAVIEEFSNAKSFT
jgi:anti-anti-sigma regulatory factor